MKYFKFVILALFVIPLMAGIYWQEPSASASFVAVTDTPTPTNTPPTDTPTPTNTPMTPTLTPPVTDTPTQTPPPGSSPTPTRVITSTPTVSTIPELGSGPRIESILLFGAILIGLLGVVTLGWFKVWQAYRHESRHG